MKLKWEWNQKPMMKPKGESKRSESTILQKTYIEKVKEERIWGPLFRLHQGETLRLLALA
jgi:hypothetical protein